MAVLATGGLEAENKLHDLLVGAAQAQDVRDLEVKDWNAWTQGWNAEQARRQIDLDGNKVWLASFR